MRLRTIYLIFSVIALVLGFSRYYYQQGLSQGQLDCAQGKAESAQSQLSQFVSASQQLATNANRASKTLSVKIAARTAADQHSTQEIRYVLKTVTRNRCEFPPDVMHQLEQARLRANQAATSGIGSGLSPSASTGEQR
ncbi:hypothetical protein EKN56_06405 [Limnobaculum zhutongyuii]|uniref:Uncharacterized protein n=2 Tax=Limnobaculum zhutongyuii TaxID=2498113 RepID=A0A411WIP6_9GAMM|nr:hypothetical protein [Limnobaculum zhutongyuii]QBH95758.1 hypothetical protein EKN56_04690 [Limnobaculum zhutongyuii]QBH96061.1 hypothetical protein EKN56_06405 [Limnobaculum zhutongyuii]